MFDIDGLSFWYGKNKALDDISLTVAPGRFYGVIGPNGCGKTTFLDLLVRNRLPGKGTIRYSGRELREYGRRKLAREIALVPQDFYINFPFTVREVVLMGRHPYIPRFGSPSEGDLRLADEIMEKLEIDWFGNKYVTELSGGEKQRVVFARALVQDTPVLILDEGTSSMDIQHTLSVLEIVAQKVKENGITVIAALHNLNLAALYSDRLLFMKSGRIVAEGNTHEVLNEKNIGEVFEVDSRVYFDQYAGKTQVVFRRNSHAKLN
ncbi:MAG: ABC transporter ATP-binding protein [Syntrophales bacterium]|nr:ABC transporter ATP-binding protein [Syntrophales bacterium]